MGQPATGTLGTIRKALSPSRPDRVTTEAIVGALSFGAGLGTTKVDPGSPAPAQSTTHAESPSASCPQYTLQPLALSNCGSATDARGPRHGGLSNSSCRLLGAGIIERRNREDSFREISFTRSWSIANKNTSVRPSGVAHATLVGHVRPREVFVPTLRTGSGRAAHPVAFASVGFSLPTDKRSPGATNR